MKDPFQHQNGSPQLTNHSSESSSLLKSMLTCPISNIEGPSLDSFRMSLNETSTGKQEHFSEIKQMLQGKPEIPSEIRKTLANPSKSVAVKSKSESSPALSSALSSSISVTKSNPILRDSLFSSSSNPLDTTSASALLKQLSVRSRQIPEEKSPSPSFPMPKCSEQLTNKTVRRQNSPATLDQPKKCKKPKGTNEEPKVIADPAKFSTDITAQTVEDNENKAKAIEEAVGSFSKFLQSSMSKHDFSAEQMKFIMASAMQSASKVITEAAEKSNATDSMRETAASFIENAIGDAIRSETSMELANKTRTSSDRLLKSLILEKSDKCKESFDDELKAKQNSGKESFKSLKKRKSENQSDTKSGGTNLGESKKKKRKVKEYLEHINVEPALPQSENGLDGADIYTTDIPIVTVKEEPIEYTYKNSENMDFQNAQSTRSNSGENERTEYTRILNPKMIVEDSLMRNVLPENITVKKEPEDVPANHSESELYKHINTPDEKANFNETRTTNIGSEIDHFKGQGTKSSKKPLRVEMKYRCQFCSLTFPNAVVLVKHIQKRHSDENTGIEEGSQDISQENKDNPLKAALEQARNSKPVLARLLSSLPKVHNKESGVPKEGMHVKDIKIVDNKEMGGNKIASGTAREMYNLKTIKTEPADMNDEMARLESGDNHIYLGSNADNLIDVGHSVESEITSRPFEKDTLNEENEKDTDSNTVVGKNSLTTNQPDISLVKIEPQSVEENTNFVSPNSSAEDNIIKKLLVTNFLDQEIEKNLKHSYSKDRQAKLIHDLDDTRKTESPTCFRCGICGLEFEHRGTLKVHQRGHNAKKSCKCQICGKSVTDTSYLKIHMRTHEPEINYEKNHDRENWETAENRNKNSLRCETCKLQFSSHGHFEMHQRMHNGEKAFKCEECGAGFVNKNQLQSHQGIHQNLKPFKCEKCGMCFRQNSGLRLHLLVHEEEKPKKCPFCTATFSRKAHLDKHIRYHSGERPFSCEICSKSFVDKELLKQHTKKVHADGNVGKRGPYKERLYPGGIREQLGPHWKGFQAVYDPSDRMEIPKSSYPCGVCGETYDEITLLVEHLETHNKPKDDEDDSDMISEEQFSNMINDDNAGNKSTDYTIRGLLNSNSGSNSSPGRPTMSTGLGLSGLNVEKLFKCPFCELSFDLPGPRIRHIHEAHPISKDSPVVLDKEDPDYFLKQHLLEDRTRVETLYGNKETTLPPPNAQDIHVKPSVTASTNTNVKSVNNRPSSNVKSISDLLNSNVNQTGSNLKSSHQTNMNVISNANSETKIPKTEPLEYDMVKTEKNDKSSSPESKDLIKLPCPYCDRVYQRQSSRTRHINENHRDKKEAFKLIKEIRDRQGPFIVE